MSLSVVIPTLNAASTLPGTLAALEGASEVIVADGGSVDGTREIAEGLGARIVRAERGRGVQLAAGAQAAAEGWLLFLHADTRLEAGWKDDADAFMTDPANTRRAACFRFALDSPAPPARRLEAMVAWRTRVFGLPYGDQGLLVSRAFYEALGGYRPIPLMEDVAMVRRIGRNAIVPLSTRAVTSAERWLKDGWWRRSARNLTCLALHFAGLPPQAIKRLYG